MEPFGTGKIASKEIARLIFEHFNLRSGVIIRDLEEYRQGRVAEKGSQPLQSKLPVIRKGQGLTYMPGSFSTWPGYCYMEMRQVAAVQQLMITQYLCRIPRCANVVVFIEYKEAGGDLFGDG